MTLAIVTGFDSKLKTVCNLKRSIKTNLIFQTSLFK